MIRNCGFSGLTIETWNVEPCILHLQKLTLKNHFSKLSRITKFEVFKKIFFKSPLNQNLFKTIYTARGREFKSQNRAIQIIKYQTRWSHKTQNIKLQIKEYKLRTYIVKRAHRTGLNFRSFKLFEGPIVAFDSKTLNLL